VTQVLFWPTSRRLCRPVVGWIDFTPHGPGMCRRGFYATTSLHRRMPAAMLAFRPTYLLSRGSNTTLTRRFHRNLTGMGPVIQLIKPGG
jgi:hypothetical protein